MEKTNVEIAWHTLKPHMKKYIANGIELGSLSLLKQVDMAGDFDDKDFYLDEDEEPNVAAPDD